MDWLDTLIDQIAGKRESSSPEDLAAKEAVEASAARQQRFSDSRGYMRDHELRARDLEYTAAMKAAPTVPYTDTTPGARERNNRSTNIPIPLLERIVTTARSTGVDPYKALAIALQETNAGTAVNYPGAVNPLHENGARVRSEFDRVPESMAHLKELETRFPGNPDKATRAYNGLGKSYIPQAVPYEQKVKSLSDSLMQQPSIVDLINNAGKR